MRDALLLLRLRLRYLRRQSQALYTRYAQVAGILLALFGLAVVERPDLIAAPLLHFSRPSPGWLPDAGWLLAWLAPLILWARVHRAFVRGGELAAYAHSLPHGYAWARAVDHAVLLRSLAIFAIPLAIAAWTVARDGSAHWPFAFLALLLVLLVLLGAGAARAAVFGLDRRALLAQSAAAILLLAARQSPLPLSVLLAAGALAPALLAWRGGVRARSTAAAPLAMPSFRVGGSGMAFLLFLHASMLLRRHAHAVLPRLGLALLVHALAWWMVVINGKHEDALAFIKLACCVSAGLLSGVHYAFWTARQTIQPFLRSLPGGLGKMLAAEHVVVSGLALLLLGLVAPVFWLADPALGAAVLRAGLVALPLQMLLGAPLIQRHRDGMLIKGVLMIPAFLLM